MSSKGKSNMVGNREIAQEVTEGITYAANDLNQYTRISTNGKNFTPEYDADGNQTLIQTSTGIWKVQYNGQNRAIRFESEDGHTVITCGYDYMGRRFEKKVTSDGAVTLHERYIYRGYLQIAAYDLREGHAEHLDLRFIVWDPTQGVATRPLAIRENGVWYTYGWDLTKNICELYGQEGFIRTIYTYSPYGQVRENESTTQSPRGIGGGLDNAEALPEGRTADGAAVSQPIQWSSEIYDAELGIVYYNFRYYNPRDGRWTRREPWKNKKGGITNLYPYVSNGPLVSSDKLGLFNLLSQNQPIPLNSSSSQQQNNTSLPPDQFDVEASDNTECGRKKNKALQDAKVKDFTAKINKKCGLPRIVCACCKGSKEGAGAWNVPKNEEKHIEEPYIVLCTNGSQSDSNTPGYLIHELTHFLQVCEKRSGETCDDYYVNEVEANRNQGKSLEQSLEDAQWSASRTGECAPYTPSNDALNKAREVYYRNY